MSEHKRFKAFRSELNESEYKETLTGYPNRGIDTDVGAVKHDSDTVQKVNGVLAALGRYTYQHTSEALIKIRTRLNLFMLDFPWTPWMWQSNPVGTFTLPVTLFGRVDGVDGMSSNIRMDGKANPMSGLREFLLSVTVEPAEDGFYRVNAKLAPQVAVMPEGVEHDGETIEEMAITAARAREHNRAIDRADYKAWAFMNPDNRQGMWKKGKAKSAAHIKKGKALEKAYDNAVKKLDTERASKKTYGRGGKVVKEATEQIEEAHKAGDTVKVPHKGKMVRGKIVRHDSGGSGKAAQHGGGYVVDVGEYGSITVPHHKIVKEAKTVKDLPDTGVPAGANKDKFKKAAEITKKAGYKVRLGKGVPAGKVTEALIGGQKRLDVNKNKRLDAQDFAMLRAKKKPVKEYTEFMPGISTAIPNPTENIAAPGKGKRFHKKAAKSVVEAVAKTKKPKKADPHAGAKGVINRQKAIKRRLEQHDMRW